MNCREIEDNGRKWESRVCHMRSIRLPTSYFEPSIFDIVVIVGSLQYVVFYSCSLNLGFLFIPWRWLLHSPIAHLGWLYFPIPLTYFWSSVGIINIIISLWTYNDCVNYSQTPCPIWKYNTALGQRFLYWSNPLGRELQIIIDFVRHDDYVNTNIIVKKVRIWLHSKTLVHT